MASMTVCASHAPGLDRDPEGLLGRDFRAGMEEVRRSIDAFDPELVVLFGGDHRRAFAEISPTFGIVLHGSLRAEGAHDGRELVIPERRARALAEGVIAAGFDLAVARGVALDHAFGQPLRQFLPHSPDVPVIPMAINCASPPLPTPGRVLALGRAVGELLDPDLRVLVIGTGGLSHSPPSLLDEQYTKTEDQRRAQIEAGFEQASRSIKPDWDAAFLAAMASWNAEKLVSMTERATEDAGVGANEVRTWLAAAAAGGGGPFRTVVYQSVPEWITGMGLSMRNGDTGP